VGGGGGGGGGISWWGGGMWCCGGLGGGGEGGWGEGVCWAGRGGGGFHLTKRGERERSNGAACKPSLHKAKRVGSTNALMLKAIMDFKHHAISRRWVSRGEQTRQGTWNQKLAKSLLGGGRAGGGHRHAREVR